MVKLLQYIVVVSQEPVLQKIKEELVKYWVLEASKGRTVEECGRFSDESFLKQKYNFHSSRAFGRPELADLVVRERGKRGAGSLLA